MSQGHVASGKGIPEGRFTYTTSTLRCQGLDEVLMVDALTGVTYLTPRENADRRIERILDEENTVRVEERIRLKLTIGHQGKNDGQQGYVYLPGHPEEGSSGVRGCVARTIIVGDLTSFDGPMINIDLDAQGRAIGIEIV